MIEWLVTPYLSPLGFIVSYFIAAIFAKRILNTIGRFLIWLGEQIK